MFALVFPRMSVRLLVVDPNVWSVLNVLKTKRALIKNAQILVNKLVAQTQIAV